MKEYIGAFAGQKVKFEPIGDKLVMSSVEDGVTIKEFELGKSISEFSECDLTSKIEGIISSFFSQMNEF